MSTFGNAFSDTTRTTSQMDPDIRSRLLNLFGPANVGNNLVNRLNQSYQPFQGQRFAGQNQDQLTFNQRVRDDIGVVDNGGRTLANVFNSAVAQGGANLPMQTVSPVSGQAISQTAFGGSGLQPQARQSVQDVVARQFADTNLAGYQNPYTDEVINRALGDLDRATQMRLRGADDQATRMGAFGGDRASIERGLIQQESLREAGNLVANLRARGFEDAANRVETDISNTLAADELNQRADAQTTRDAMAIAADVETGNQAQTQRANEVEALNRLRSSQALLDAFGQGSDVYQDFLANFGAVGDRQMALDQRQLDFDFEEFARAVDYDQNMINNMIRLLAAAPGNKTEESSTELSTLGQVSNALDLIPGLQSGFEFLGDLLPRRRSGTPTVMADGTVVNIG